MSNGDDNNDDNNDVPGSSESALDDLFVEGARFREPSAAERAAWAKEQRKQVNKSKRRRKRERPAGEPGESGPRSSRRAAVAVVVLFVLTFIVFYVFNPGGGGGGSSNQNANADLLAGQPRQVAAYEALPAGTTSDPALADAIRHDIDVTQQWFKSQTGGQELRFRQTNGVIDVQVKSLTATASDLKTRSDASGLVRDGFRGPQGALPDEIVLAFVKVDRQTDCGQGGLGYAVVWVGSCGLQPSINSTWPNGESKVIAHELIHALGAVASCAPHYDNGHVTDTPLDLMYDGSERGTGEVQLDPGHDDYYKHHIKNCIDVARHPAWTSS